jgi:hypothetical protein
MTRQSTFKQKIRARMTKTGERYAAARLALLRENAPPIVTPAIPAVPGYPFVTGVEPDISRLASAMAQARVVDPATGEAFTELRLFGLSGGIGFMYFLFEYKGYPPMMTFVCRSWSMPGPVIGRALEHAGIEHELRETTSAAAARRVVDEALASGRAAHVTLDFASLPSSGAPAEWIGQAPRQANVVGSEEGRYLVDIGGPKVLDHEVLARARAACRKEKHRSITFQPGVAGKDPVLATRTAVRSTARSFVEAPFKGFTSNFGLAGLEKVARLSVDEKDKKGWPRVFDSGPLAYRALYRTWECATFALTPPAGGRSYYAEFLAEASSLPGLSALRDAAALARKSGDLFGELAEEAVRAAPEVASAVAIAEEIDELQRSGEASAADRVVALRAERDALAGQCELDAAARRRAFERIGAGFSEIHRVEQELQRVLGDV